MSTTRLTTVRVGVREGKHEEWLYLAIRPLFTPWYATKTLPPLWSSG